MKAKSDVPKKKVDGNGNADGLDIPKSLKVENRTPLAPEAKVKIDAKVKAAQEAAKPKLSLNKEVPKKDSVTKRIEERAEKKVRGEVTVAGIAKEYGLIPREARALLRAAKLPKPKGGWAYDAKDAALEKVREVLKAGKAPTPAAAKGAVTYARRKAAVVPPPSETVWSGKAKIKRVAAPIAVNVKADVTKEVKKLAKGVKVMKLPAGEKTPKAKIVKK